MNDEDRPEPGPDTSYTLRAEADILYQARHILVTRFRTGKHDETAKQVRSAAAELVSRARHPSRNPQGLHTVRTGPVDGPLPPRPRE